MRNEEPGSPIPTFWIVAGGKGRGKHAGGQAGTPPTGDDAGATPPPRDTRPWDCKVCTVVGNKWYVGKCEVCEAPRGRDRARNS